MNIITDYPILVIAICILLLAFIVYFISHKHILPEEELLFSQGYEAAKRELDRSKDTPQDLYNYAQSEDEWDKGWKAACIEYGANED